MFNKNSNKTLWLVFGVLLIVVVLIFTTESTKKERSFKTDIVSVDTSAVTSFSIFPKSKPGEEVKFLRDGSFWKVTGASGKTFTAASFKIKNLLGELTRIKPKRVAARSQSKWAEYQVDSAATRVVVNEDGSEVLDLIIGKFAFQQPRSMSTFVRLTDETDVYEVDGFLEMIFNKDANSFRDETVIKSDRNNWNKLVFSNSDSESFELIKVDGHWTIDGQPTDSAKTLTALSSLARLTNTDYIDNSEVILPPQIAKLSIEVTDSNPIEVVGYKSDSIYLIQSSQNKEAFFDGNKIGDKVFLKKDSFF
jgi:hypothetical protein